jgi:hypothetical protein
MPRTPEKIAPPAAIKWTDDEWESIAGRLLQVRGRDLLSSRDLAEVKAKDIFDAQEVLPEERHRKLISVSQGFAATRQRLQDIFRSMKVIPQNDLFGGTAQAEEGQAELEKGRTRRASRKEAPSPPQDKAAGNTEPSSRQTGKKPARNAEAKAETVSTAPEADAATDTTPAAVAVNVERDTDQRRAAAEALPGASAAAPALLVAEEERARSQDDESPAPAKAHTVKDMPKPQGGQGTRRPQPVTAPRLAEPATASLVELARPFVAMVCEELAAALVNALSRSAGGQGLSAALQAALLPAAGQQSASQARSNRSERHREQRMNTSGDMAEHVAPDNAKQAPAPLHEEEHPAEPDVQPLFDPKLPPSANSSFKPMIGLIGTSADELEDLKPYYPQLQLAIVPVDTVRSADILKECQRMIGLREEVPAPMDAFLRQVFRQRYVRISGGIGQIREQLNVWLDNPGSMQAGNGRPPRQQGKGGGGAKKWRKRNPRPAHL